MKGDILSFLNRGAPTKKPEAKVESKPTKQNKEEIKDASSSEDEIIGYSKRLASKKDKTEEPLQISKNENQEGKKRKRLKKQEAEEEIVEIHKSVEIESEKKRGKKRVPPPAKERKGSSSYSGTELVEEGSSHTELAPLDEEEKKDEKKEEKKRGKREKKPKETAKRSQSKKKPPVEPTGSQPLLGKTFVISGVLDTIVRNDLQNVLLQLGAKVTGSVSSRTTYLVVGSILEDGRPVESGNKYKKAQANNTEILHEAELEALLQKATNNPDFTLGKALSILSGQIADKPKSVKKEEKKIDKQKPDAKSNELWVDKYAPVSSEDIIGNAGVVKKLEEWLKDWEKVVIQGEKKHVQFRPGMNKENMPNPNARACLISGSPGIGKSTAAKLVAKENGYEPLETNASDNRNKKIIDQLLSEAVGTESIAAFARGENDKIKIGNKTVVIMDEVDGVSGNSDRGGIAALIKIIKTTKVPIICICNDRQSTKVRSLANHCYDLKFIKPQCGVIKNYLKGILENQGVQMDDNALELFIQSSGNDIRQMINTLQLQSSANKGMSFLEAKKSLQSISKDEETMLTPFNAATKLLNSREASLLTLRKRINLFFVDFELMPLLIQENYLSGINAKETVKDMENIAESADCISFGDCINNSLRRHNDWTLLPDVGMWSCVAPCSISAKSIGFAKFPTWFGKFSKYRKTTRQLKELANSFAGKVSVPNDSLLNDVIPLLLQEIVRLLKGENEASVEGAINLMNSFRITIEQFKENMLELCPNSKATQIYSNLNPKAKSSFTRIYHKLHPDPIAKHKIKDTEVGPKEKFDPDIESVDEQVSEENAEEEEEEEKEEKIIKPKGKAKNKPKTTKRKPSKKQTQKKTKEPRKAKKSKSASSEISESI